MRSRVASALLLLVAAVAGPVTAAAPARSLLLGAWQVDVSRLPVPEPPKSVTIAWSEAPGNRIRMTVDIVARDGARSHAESEFLTDGTPARAEGSLDVDIVSMRMPNRRTLVMGAGMAGKPSNTRVFTLADDDRHLLEVITTHDANWTPVTRVNTWTRVDGRGP